MDSTLETWKALVRHARARLSLPETVRLDRALQKRFSLLPPAETGTRPVRLAVLGSSTLDHLLPGIRVGGLRRGLWVACHTTAYGQYWQELSMPGSALHQFRPDAILLSFDAAHFSPEGNRAMEAAQERLRAIWQAARSLGAQVIQQTFLNIAPASLGENEHRKADSAAEFIPALNQWLRSVADTEGIDLLALDRHAARDGLFAWHDPALWYRAKQEISPAGTPLYGDLVGRILAAQQGRSAKCLVLDLDNTLWGGVVGDDGVSGIELGQGSATGEAFLAVQQYCRALARRGVILAVCSKNEEKTAWRPFDEHPEMILRRSDIACFVANWDDKAHNLRAVAKTLNLGVDALVFLDDNPFERNLVRRELPEVAVPELPEDPALYPQCLADAGYFEALSITDDDRERTRLYQENRARDEVRASATDLAGYLGGLEMVMTAMPFDEVNHARILQLINKSNQFNLTARRYSDAEVRSLARDPAVSTWQLRLRDRFGDNGLVAVVIARHTASHDLEIDSWLMSCRVLGRTMEEATLNLLLEEARRQGAQHLRGEYRRTEKNALVAEHYSRLGFSPLGAEDGASTRWELTIAGAAPLPTYVQLA